MSGTERTLASLGALSSKWLSKAYSYRSRAVARLVRRSGFSERMAHKMLDALFSELTAPKLRKLLKAEFRDPAVLDGFVRETRNSRSVRARGPATLLHVLPANIPGAAVTSFVLGLLIGSRNVGKPSGRDAGFLDIYLDSMKAHDRALARRCVLVTGRRDAAAWAEQAGLVVAYGDDASLERLRRELPGKTPFIGYGHRVSLSLILEPTERAARNTAHDVWMADQRGCLSPALVFARNPAEGFAAHLARELGRLEKSERSRPRRTLADRVSMRGLRDRMRLAQLRGKKGRIWQGDTWTVLFDPRPGGELSAGSQVIRVAGFDRLRDLEDILQKIGPSLQAVALECAPAYRKKIAEWLAVLGANRICRAGRLQHPPLTWHHDGKAGLAGWVQWTDLENS